MAGTAIDIRLFSFSYGSKRTLEGFSCSIEEGEYVSVIGSNGAGKSTLLKCLNRIERGGEGVIELFGRALPEYTQKELGRLIGYVSQIHDREIPYTVTEFILMGRYAYMTPLSRITAEDQRVVEEIFSLTGLRDLAHRRMNSLSGGERQKVYLAGALAQQPKLLLLDEPTTHLDPKYQMGFQKLIAEIAVKLGMTVLHVTHDLTHIALWSQKIMALKEGRLHFYGSPEEVLTNENLQKIFEIDFLKIPDLSTGREIILPKV